MSDMTPYRDIRPDGTVLRRWTVHPETGGYAPDTYEPILGTYWRQVFEDGVWVTVGRVVNGVWKRPA